MLEAREYSNAIYVRYTRGGVAVTYVAKTSSGNRHSLSAHTSREKQPRERAAVLCVWYIHRENHESVSSPDLIDYTYNTTIRVHCTIKRPWAALAQFSQRREESVVQRFVWLNDICTYTQYNYVTHAYLITKAIV